MKIYVFIYTLELVFFYFNILDPRSDDNYVFPKVLEISQENDLKIGEWM